MQLLSGGNHDIDVDDLRKNTRYTGGYSDGSRTIKIFWEVIKGFEPKERCMLLKFVTFIISVLSFLGYSSWFECGYRSRPRCKSTQCSIRSSHSSGTFMEFWLLYVILLPYIKVPDHEYNAKFTIWCLRSLEIVLLQRLGYFPQ